jgi:hypothetical protein
MYQTQIQEESELEIIHRLKADMTRLFEKMVVVVGVISEELEAYDKRSVREFPTFTKENESRKYMYSEIREKKVATGGLKGKKRWDA